MSFVVNKLREWMNIIYRNRREKFQFLNKSAKEYSTALSYCHIYRIVSPDPRPPSCPLQLGRSFRQIIQRKNHAKIKVLVWIFPLCSEVIDTSRKPREMSQLGKKSAKVFHCLYSSTEQLQMALWAHMFLNLGLNKEKSIHTLPLQALHLQYLHL